MKTVKRLILLFTFLFLYMPIATIVVYSFNDSKRIGVWRAFTFKYYTLALTNHELLWAVFNSVCVALVSALVALVLGTSSAYALWRFRFPCRGAVGALFSMPIIVPEICMGIALMVFFSRAGLLQDFTWPLNLMPIIVAHVAFSFPFVTIVVHSSLALVSFELVEAAVDLGSHEWELFRRVVLPLLRTSLWASFLLALSLSLDDFIITFFTTSPGTSTLPLKIYSMVRYAVSPEVNAISTLLLVATLVLACLGVTLQRRGQRPNKGPNASERRTI